MYMYFFMRVSTDVAIFNFLLDLTKTDILFVKILQAVSYSYKCIDDDMQKEITKYTDSVPYTEDDIDQQSLQEVSKNGFTFVYDSPIKSGMISLVYLIHHVDTQEEYILKLKRRNIHQKLDTCISNMQTLLKTICYVTQWWWNIDITNTIERHLLLLNEQLDFKKEIHNTESMYSNFEHIHYVRIPKIYPTDFTCSSNYIIMECLQGRHLSQLTHEEYPIYCDLVAKMGCVSLFVHGESHGDFHAGNLIFMYNELDEQNETVPEYQIGVIDFGLTIKITDRIKDAMIYAATNYRNVTHIPTIIKKYLDATLQPEGIIDFLPAESKNKILAELENSLRMLAIDKINCSQEHFYKSFQVINENLVSNLVDKYDIKMTDDFIKVQVASSMSNGLLMQLCDGDYNKQVDKTMKELFHLDFFTDE
jgi:predicted unusual protein kinase regulating ubiquinone biosynthesis (AarF/ABC1/UbiB family)